MTEKSLHFMVEMDCDGPLTYVQRMTDAELAAQSDPSEWFPLTYDEYRRMERELSPNYGGASLLGSGTLPDYASFKGYIRF